MISMRLMVTFRKATWIGIALMTACAAGLAVLLLATGQSVPAIANEQWAQILDDVFKQKNKCLLSGPCEDLKALYVANEKNSDYAIEAEQKRAVYLSNWAEKQGVRFVSVNSRVTIGSVKKVGRGYSFFLMVSTEYQYAYADVPDAVNSFRVGTYHTIDLIPSNGGYVISREWYRDPFYDSLMLQKLKTEEIQSYINAQKPKDTPISDRRKKAAAYADKYCGSATDEGSGFAINTKYPNFVFVGGDCTNYVSQALYESGFKRNGTWNFTKVDASKAWCNAQGFKNYMLNSGRASLIAKGSYKEVYKMAYKLMPGDIISYERNGKISHNVIVVGYDSKGYPMVDSHTTDRYRAPWDIGWNDSDIKFYLLHVNF